MNHYNNIIIFCVEFVTTFFNKIDGYKLIKILNGMLMGKAN